MQSEQCAAIATSTGQQCRHGHAPGSRFCLWHIEKAPVFVSALIGALVSILLGLAVGVMLPSREVRELWSLRRELKPIVEFARVAYPGMPTDSALEALRGDIERLEDRIARAHYRPLARDRALELRELAQRMHAPGLHVRFVATEGSANRRLLAEELQFEFSTAGLRATAAASTVVSSGPSRAMLVRYGAGDSLAAAQLVQALETVARGRILTKAEEDWDAGYLLVHIEGDPLFENDGTVTFR